MSAIVDKNSWRKYFGPFSTFSRRSFCYSMGPLDINKATYIRNRYETWCLLLFQHLYEKNVMNLYEILLVVTLINYPERFYMMEGRRNLTRSLTRSLIES